MGASDSMKKKVPIRNHAKIMMKCIQEDMFYQMVTGDAVLDDDTIVKFCQ